MREGREGRRERETGAERSTEGDRRADSRRAGEKGRECAASPFLPPRNMYTHTSPTSRVRKETRGTLGPRWTTRIHIPTASSRAQGLPGTVGDRQGNVRGVGVLYQAGARGGELSSSKRSVSVT